jgi:hypothetical protein
LVKAAAEDFVVIFGRAKFVILFLIAIFAGFHVVIVIILL